MLNALDWVILGVIGTSAFLSILRGFIREASSIVSWIVAFVVSSKLYLVLAPKLTFSNDPAVRKCVAIMILFVGTLIIAGYISKFICKLISKAGLSSMDRLLGVFFGLARGVLIVSAIYALVKILFVFKILLFLQANQMYQTSILIPELEKIVNWFFLYMGSTDTTILPNELDQLKTGA